MELRPWAVIMPFSKVSRLFTTLVETLIPLCQYSIDASTPDLPWLGVVTSKYASGWRGVGERLGLEWLGIASG